MIRPRALPFRLGALFAALGASLALAAAPAPKPGAPPTNPEGYRLAVPPHAFSFPRDHASHPAFQTEWWYYTGHLAAGTRRFGFELTFFRVGLPRKPVANPSAWAAHDLVFLHLAVTDERGRRFLQHDDARREALGIAGADSTRYRVWLSSSRAWLDDDGSTHRLQGHAPGFGLDLALTPLRPPIVHGRDGVSPKTPGLGNASHYYSLTRLAAAGSVTLGRDTLEVTGLAWMDHEFASNRLSDTHTGWDWLSVQLEDGHDLMLYQLRRRDGTIEPLSHGTWVTPGGKARALTSADFRITPSGAWTSPRTGTRYPAGWRIEIAGEALSLEVSPVLQDQELIARSMGNIAYWEGACRVRGTRRGTPASGEAYVELTGYGGRAPY